MSTVIEGPATASPDPEAAPPTETVADLLERLGDIPPNRVRLRPAPGTATVEDVVRIEADENRLFELIDGVLVEKTVGFYESFLAMELGIMLGGWVRSRNLGIVVGADGMMRLFPKQVRIPDAAYISWARLGGKMPTDAAPLVAPDLAVEVLSESNTKRELARKLEEYFDSGVRLVWIVDGKSKTVREHTAAAEFRVIGLDGILSGGHVLPGFTLQLKDLFTAPTGPNSQ